MPTEFKDKITDEDKKIIQEAAEVAKKIQKDEKSDKDAIEQAVKDLNEAIMPIGAKMYQTAEGSADGSSDEKADDKSSKKGKKSKDDKDEPIEGEVVNE